MPGYQKGYQFKIGTRIDCGASSVVAVAASKAKTRQHRLAPISENLKLWLTPAWQALGPGYAEHKNEIAVVLTDMSMPFMDGPAEIRALIRINPAIKIVVMSGLSENSRVTKVSGADVKYFLTKPYTAGTLLKTVRAILDEI